MKKLFFASVVSLLVIACSDKKKTEESSTKTAEMKAVYEKNLAALKTGIAAFENETLDAFAALVSDNVRWHSPAYGDTVTSKAHWLESLKYFADNWSNLKLTNARFHPGVDSATHEFDGSVRYYGIWSGIHSSGKPTSSNFYGTFDFDKDNKVISASEFFDVTGLMNAVKPQ